MGICPTVAVTDLEFLETIKEKMRVLGDRSNQLAITNEILKQMIEERKQLFFQPKPQSFYKSNINAEIGGKYTLDENLIIGHVKDGFIEGDGIIMDKENIYVGNLSKDKPQGAGIVYKIEKEAKVEMTGLWNKGILEDFKIDHDPNNIIKNLTFTFAGQNLSIVYQDGCTYVGKGVKYDNRIVKNDVGIFNNPKLHYEYNGEWFKDKRHGTAKVFVNGILTFSGTFENDRKKKGKLVKGGFVYDGDWDENGVFTGKRKTFNNELTLSN